MKDNQLPTKILTMFVLAALIVAGALIFYNAPQTVAARAMDFSPNLPNVFPNYYPIDPGYCIEDVDGANDYPGQKDLTRLCFDDVSEPGTFLIQWNWDERGTSGANTLDGTTFFDSDGDGNANYAMNVTTTGNPAVFSSARLYSCSDNAPLKCTGGVLVPGFDFSAVCGVYQESTSPLGDPFPAGADYPWDTVGYCEIPTSAFAQPVNVLNTCSKTSESIESNEEDCVAVKGGGFITIIKNEYPAQGNNWLFEVRHYLTNALVKSAILVPSTDPLSENFSTAQIRYSVASSTYNVAETNPGAYGYTLVAAACTDEGVALGGASNPFTNMMLQSGHEIKCEFTNAIPTAVELAEFSAAPLTNAVNLTWTTVSEIDITGYNILRSTDGIDYGHKLNAELIPAQNFGQMLGATYTFLDETALFGQTYYYRLELALADGNTEFSDQVQAVPAGYRIFAPLTMK